MNNLLELKNRIKARKPDFVRADYNKEIFKNKWRKPRGLHNKRRLKKKGHQKNPSPGYGSPKPVKYLHKSGLEIIHINSIRDLSKITRDNQAAVLSAQIGRRYKVEILEVCLKDKIRVLNVKDIGSYLSKIKSDLEQRKKEKKRKEEKKKVERTKAEKKAEGKKEDKQEEIKQEVMEAKPEIKQTPIQEATKKDTSKSKAGHMAGSVPGTKQ